MNPDGSVTEQQPPNNKLFDTTHITHMSPVIARRKADQAAQFAAVMASNPQGPPVFNISLGNDFASMFQPQPPALPALPVQPPPPLPPPSSTLIPVNREPGTDMPFSDFCRQYGLSSNVLDKLIQFSVGRSG